MIIFFRNLGEVLVESIPIKETCNPRFLANSIRLSLFSKMSLGEVFFVKAFLFIPTKITTSFNPIL